MHPVINKWKFKKLKKITYKPRARSVYKSANFFWINWFAAKGLPNWTLSKVYDLAACIQNSPAPIVPHDIPRRAIFKQENGPFKPLMVGNIFSLGTWLKVNNE